MNIETTELHILILDDDKADSTYLANCIRAVAPLAKIDSAATCRKAKAHLRAHPCDAVFLEIPFDKEGDAAGVSLALDLRTEFPNLNIIFCTAHTEYKPQAMDLHASGFITKPATTESVLTELRELRYPPVPPPKIRIRTFGEFEVFSGQTPLIFQYAKSKELLAILVDARGEYCTNEQLIGRLWEDAAVDPAKNSYLRNLRQDLLRTLTDAGCENLILRKRGSMAIDPAYADCDYFDLYDRKLPADIYRGEYMNQYSWAEATNGSLYALYLEKNKF